MVLPRKDGSWLGHVLSVQQTDSWSDSTNRGSANTISKTIHGQTALIVGQMTLILGQTTQSSNQFMVRGH